MNRLMEKYQKEIIPAMQETFGYKNKMAVPQLIKATINVGVGKNIKDPKFNEVVESTLERITGQRPVKTKAKKSISNFKIREGQVVGQMVTLRGKRMYDFIDKLISVTLPRVRDFRGLEIKTIDGRGNLSIGFKEHMSFPEIKADEVEKIHGLQVTITTNTKSKAEGLKLFQLLGFPFHQE